VDSNISRLAAQLGMTEEELWVVMVNSYVDIDKTKVWEEYDAIEKSILSLLESIAGLGVGNLTEILRNSGSSTKLEMVALQGGNDILVSVESSSAPFYGVRIMQGRYLGEADRGFIYSGFRARFDETEYQKRFSLSKFGEVLVTNSGLIIYNGEESRRRIVGRNKSSAYISIGEPQIDHTKRAYFELKPWLRAESLNDQYKSIAQQLRLLPNLVKTVVGNRIK